MVRIGNNTKIKLNEDDAIRSAKFLHQMFTDLNIRYWMDYGTLLGIVRDKKFIPYDTDIECYMFFRNRSDKQKVINFLHRSEFAFVSDLDDRQGVTIIDKEGYIHMSFGWFKYHPILRRLIPKRLMIKLGKRYVRSTNEVIRPHEGEVREKRKLNCWIRSFLPLVFVGKTKKVPFYDFEVCIPERAEELLEIRYGKDWRIPMKKYKGYTV